MQLIVTNADAGVTSLCIDESIIYVRIRDGELLWKLKLIEGVQICCFAMNQKLILCYVKDGKKTKFSIFGWNLAYLPLCERALESWAGWN